MWRLSASQVERIRGPNTESSKSIQEIRSFSMRISIRWYVIEEYSLELQIGLRAGPIEMSICFLSGLVCLATPRHITAQLYTLASYWLDQPLSVSWRNGLCIKFCYWNHIRLKFFFFYVNKTFPLINSKHLSIIMKKKLHSQIII